MGRKIAAAFLGAVVVFVFGFVTWGILTKVITVYRPVPAAQQAAFLEAVNQLPGAGMYLYPYPEEDTPQAQQEMMEQMKTGPALMLSVKTGGYSMGPVMLQGFLHTLLSAILLVIFGHRVGVLDGAYCRRVMFFSWGGLFAGFWSEFGRAIWFQQPWDFQLYFFAYSWLSWLLAGLVMAAILKPRAEAA